MELAVIALVVSIVSLLWNIGNSWIRWPRVAVTIRETKIVNMGTDEVTESYKLIVVNVGAEAMTVANVGLRTTDLTMFLDWEQETDRGMAAVRFVGPELPVRLEGHGSATWVINEDGLARFLQNSQIVGYVQRYRKPWRFPKRFNTAIREVKSSNVATRNGTRNPALPDRR